MPNEAAGGALEDCRRPRAEQRGTTDDRQLACYARLIAGGASREEALNGLVDHLIQETVGAA